MARTKKRFETVFEEGLMQKVKIIVDKKTGVNYLCIMDGTVGSVGVTPLLDSEGKTVINKD
jgi:hypothetical protein